MERKCTAELVDSIQQALEQDGTLLSIRATLRANVLNILGTKAQNESISNGKAPRQIEYLLSKQGINTTHKH